MKKKISVILTTYNIEKYIKESLLSLINQNFNDYEIIVLDDGSNDLTLNVIQKYTKSFDFIKLYSFSNLNAGELRNEGIKLSKGEYIIFLDGDDIFHEDFLYRMYEKIKTEKADICICNSFEFSKNKKNILKKHFHKTIPYSWAWDKLIKKSLIEKNKIQFSKLKSSNDILFTYLCCFLSDKIVKIDDILIYRRIRENSLTSNRNEENVFLAVLELQENLKERNIYETFEKEFKIIAMQTILWHYTSSKNKNKMLIIYKAMREYEKDFHIADLNHVNKEYSNDLELYKKAIASNSYFSFKIQNKILDFKKIIIK